MNCFEKNCFNEITETISKENFTAAVDFPVSSIFDDLLKKYPEAKIILNVSDDPKEFVKSVRNSYHALTTLPPYTNIFKISPAPLCYLAPRYNREGSNL
jgi:hypothetical protein